MLELTIKDTGDGFDVECYPSSEAGGWGSASTRERIKSMSGSAEFRSKPNARTTVRLRKPSQPSNPTHQQK
jgi:signal transduction histidine kinase